MPTKKAYPSKKSPAPRPQRSPAHRLRSVKLVLVGEPIAEVAKKFGDARRTVAVWVEWFKKDGEAGLERGTRPGRPSTLNPSETKKLWGKVAEAYKRSRKVSGGTLLKLIKDEFGATLTRRQCERILSRLNAPTKKYFAYGSNMLTHRLRARVPSADNPSRFALNGYSLRFHKRSDNDGSAKCNIINTGSTKDVVHGIIFDVPEIQSGALDRAEGLGNGYKKETWTFETGGQSHDMFVYIAEPSYINESLQPFEWYHKLVIAGAEQHGLPVKYVTKLKSISFREDHDLERKERKDAIKALAAYTRSKQPHKR
ncbi:MAG: gamma-glutamylcyclotransferase [Candidatus Didemnitutus sp.]|nr:gamma-glutamylcyclotransferase [Candidatus Didemnitutus sp.]